MTGLRVKPVVADATYRIESSRAVGGTGLRGGPALYRPLIRARMEAMMSDRIALALVTLLMAATAHAAPTAKIEQLAWLAGCWQLEGQPVGAGEQWSTLAGGTLFGSSRSLHEGRTVGFEFMSLRQHDDGRLVFPALPNGRNATDFGATRVDANEAVFENPANDFPQRIHYRRRDDNHLHARIEVARDNPTQAMDFPMHRVACGGPGVHE